MKKRGNYRDRTIVFGENFSVMTSPLDPLHFILYPSLLMDNVAASHISRYPACHGVKIKKAIRSVKIL